MRVYTQTIISFDYNELDNPILKKLFDDPEWFKIQGTEGIGFVNYKLVEAEGEGE